MDLLKADSVQIFETICLEIASNRINGGKMIKKRYRNRFKHLKEKFYPSTDLGNYDVYNLETLYIYK